MRLRVRNYVWIQQKISEYHINFNISSHCKRTIAKNPSLQRQMIQKLVYSPAYCPFFSSNSAVVLALILGACKSERFLTAEYNKSEK